MLVTWTTSLIKPSVVKKSLSKMVNSDFSFLTEDLGGELKLTLISGGNEQNFGVHVKLDSKNVDINSETVCANGIQNEILCLYSITSVVEPLLEPLVARGWLPKDVHTWRILESFKQVEFPTSTYSIAELALELANRDPDITFTRSKACLLYTSPSPRDQRGSRMPSSA